MLYSFPPYLILFNTYYKNLEAFKYMPHKKYRSKVDASGPRRINPTIGSDRIHVGIRLDLMEISIKPTNSWSNSGGGPTFGTLVSD